MEKCLTGDSTLVEPISLIMITEKCFSIDRSFSFSLVMFIYPVNE